MSQLIAAIKYVAGGEYNVKCGVGPAGVARPVLTRREIEVLELVASGWSSPEIAEELSIAGAAIAVVDLVALHELNSNG